MQALRLIEKVSKDGYLHIKVPSELGEQVELIIMPHSQTGEYSTMDYMKIQKRRTCGMTYRGKIFKLPFPFTDLSGKKARPALAVSEPDIWGDIEFLFITTKQSRSYGRTIDLTDDVFASKKLPFPSILHLDKKYLLSKDIILKEITAVADTFLEKVVRELTIVSAVKHFEVKHKKNKVFTPGDRIPYAGRVFDEKEIAALVDSSLDFWLTTGRYAEKFEKDFAKFLGVKHCSLTNSGSSKNQEKSPQALRSL